MAKAKILYVEDSKTQGMITKKFLEESGYAVTWVADGSSALRQAQGDLFDVVLLDCMLPDMDGNDVCMQLKHDHGTRGIPVIMVTAKDALSDKINGLESGADDYLAKPYDECELKARLYAALRTKRLQDELIQKNNEMRDMLSKVEMLSVTDPLTQLFNRRRFEDVLAAEFKKAKRYATHLSCIMIDIDFFKSINDTYGHTAGDTVLKEIAVIIKQCIRTVDTACRWGGEEFIVLTPMTSKAFAIQPARRIWNSVSSYDFPSLSGRAVTISAGIADAASASIDTPDKLIHEADLALYQAKKAGRNRIEIQG